VTKILLVDDDASLRRIAQLSLTRVGGFEVLEAGSGHDALTLAAGEHPAMILLDVMMPGLDGPTTLAALRANPDTAAIPVVFLTAKVQRAEIDRFLGLGVRGVIAKPFDPMTLSAEVRRLLELR